MRSVQSKVLVPLLLVALVFSAVAAAAAQAATEGPFYKVSGTRLGASETKVLKASAKENYIFQYSAGTQIECTTMSVAANAKIIGSAGANSSTSEESMVFSGCHLSGDGAPCEIKNGTITTSALKGTLGYATSTRAGRLVELLKPASGTLFASVSPTGIGCKVENLSLSGSLIADLSGGGSPIEVGVNETQGTVRELVFPLLRVKEMWTESAGALTKKTAELTNGGVLVHLLATFNLELESAPNWGFFT